MGIIVVIVCIFKQNREKSERQFLIIKAKNWRKKLTFFSI